MHRGVVLFLLPGVLGSFGGYQDLQQMQQPPDEYPETGPTAIQETTSQENRQNYGQVQTGDAEQPDQPEQPVPAFEPIAQNPPPGNLYDRLCQLSKPAETPAIGVDRLNQVMNRVGRELHFLTEKSRECLFEKVKSLNQLKRMREGLKNAYRDIYNLQGTLTAYQTQLKEMQNYIENNRDRVVVVDNKQLGDMYGMVRRLQSAAENMISVAMRSQKPVLA